MYLSIIVFFGIIGIYNFMTDSNNLSSKKTLISRGMRSLLCKKGFAFLVKRFRKKPKRISKEFFEFFENGKKVRKKFRQLNSSLFC